MGKRCVAGGCSNTPKSFANWEEVVSLHRFPNRDQDYHRYRLWVQFVQKHRADFNPTDKNGKHRVVFLCSKHFEDSCFANKQEYLHHAAHAASSGEKPALLLLTKQAVSTLPATSLGVKRPLSSSAAKRKRRREQRMHQEYLCGVVDSLKSSK